MDAHLLALGITALSLDLLQAAAFAYVARAERARYLELWAWGAASQAVAEMLAVPALMDRGHPALTFGALWAVWTTGALMLRGGAAWSGSRPSHRWWIVAVSAIVYGTAASCLGWSIGWASGPSMLGVGAAHIAVGIGLWRDRRRHDGLGLPVAVVGLVLSGLHLADFPFLSPLPAARPWGLAFDALAESVTTLGLLALHFERARRDATRAETSYLALADSLGVGVFEIDTRGEVRFANDALARMLGFSDASTMPRSGEAIAVLVEPHDLGSMPASRVEVTWRRGARLAYGERQAGWMRSTNGEQVLRGFLVDRTEARRLEEEVRNAHRLDAMGQLAGGVAHDFNNLMTVVGTNLDVALQRPDDPDVADALVDARGAAARAAELAGRLLAFGRRRAGHGESDVGAAVRQACELVGRSAPRHPLHVHITDGLRAPVERGAVEQVIVNLVLNARDASPPGEPIAVEVNARDGQVEIVVADHGVGMTEDVCARVFEPFFTTKATGTGLGLASVATIVREAGGAVHVDSHPGQGTRFTIRLPRHQAASPSAPLPH